MVIVYKVYLFSVPSVLSRLSLFVYPSPFCFHRPVNEGNMLLSSVLSMSPTNETKQAVWDKGHQHFFFVCNDCYIHVHVNTLRSTAFLH